MRVSLDPAGPRKEAALSATMRASFAGSTSSERLLKLHCHTADDGGSQAVCTDPSPAGETLTEDKEEGQLQHSLLP